MLEKSMELTKDSIELRQLIAQEINLIPDENLAGFYQFIHYFRLGSQVASNGAMASSNGHYTGLLKHKVESKIIEKNDNSTVENEEKSVESILSFAGAWSDIPDEEFDDFLNDIYARRRGEHLVAEA